jgi:hypothetical protein
MTGGRLRLALVGCALAVLLLAPFSDGGGFAGRNGPLIATAGGAVSSVPLDGGAATSLVTGTSGSLSPTGSRLAYVSGGAIHVKCLTGTACDNPIPGATGSEPVWSPDGATIAFVTTAGTLATVTVAANGTSFGAITPLAPSETNVSGPAWSPDGTAIAFSSTRGTAQQIWKVVISSGVETQVTTGTTDVSPSWSPDGTEIAFSSNATTIAQIYVVSAAGGGVTQLTNDATADTDPIWSPDGDLIAFLNVHTLKTIPAAGGSSGESNVGSPGWDDLTDWQTLVPTADSTSPPEVVSGANPVQGDTISASTGSWLGSTTDYRYQFERCGSDGTGCTPFGTASSSSSYTLTSDDVGSTVRVLVTAIDSAGSSTAVESSNATPVVLGPGPTNLSLPVVTIPSDGVLGIGDFVSGTAGSWTGSGNTFSFQWKRCATATSSCAFIPGATSSFYSPVAADFGQWLRIQVQATNSSGARSFSSSAVGPVTADKPAFHDSPPIFGINQVGQTLSTGYGTWTGTFPITYTVQWRRCDPQGTLPSCVAIAGATSTSYMLTNSDNGVALRAYVTATNVAGSVISISNHTFPTLPAPAPTGKDALAPLNESPPAVTGQPLVGSALQGSPGTWVGSEPIKFTYSWSRCDATGEKCQKIAKATKIDYAVSSKDSGFTLRLTVVAKNVVGVVSSKSDVTDTVAMIKPPVRGRRIIGSKRADYLPGGGGNDYIDGRAGNDTILGGAGNDTLIGGTGNDVIDGGSGTDKIVAGAGSDTIRAADGFKDHVDCGAGDDRVFADRVDVLVHCEVVTYPTG